MNIIEVRKTEFLPGDYVLFRFCTVVQYHEKQETWVLCVTNEGLLLNYFYHEWYSVLRQV